MRFFLPGLPEENRWGSFVYVFPVPHVLLVNVMLVVVRSFTASEPRPLQRSQQKRGPGVCCGARLV